MNDTPLRNALLETINGLNPPIENNVDESKHSSENLLWMLNELKIHILDWPTDKISRWIGFIQGVGAVKGWLDVNDERNRTRPFFHKAYAEMGFQIPETKG